MSCSTEDNLAYIKNLSAKLTSMDLKPSRKNLGVELRLCTVVTLS